MNGVSFIGSVYFGLKKSLPLLFGCKKNSLLLLSVCNQCFCKVSIELSDQTGMDEQAELCLCRCTI